ncbi:MAG: Na+/H+ antiporter NhaA [Gammaproteobacteria bacterium]|nr:Na+/H+ antiporter NhaA [Gammaproteobacteria bacterium]
MTARISDQNMFHRFLHSQVTGSLILIVTTILALIWANSQWGDFYYELSHTYFGVHFGDWEFSLSLSHWIKDGLMAIFFFVVGLEIKREIVVGELSSVDKAMLPVCAALGGAIVPAAIYALVNSSGEAAAGWGIPMATDIAFALGVLSMFGSRVPLGLKVFLTALAIADDLLAVAVIAVFYTPELDFGILLFAAIPLGIMVALSHAGVRATWIYALLAFIVWLGVLGSGVHATIAGVLVAMVIPVRPAIDPGEFTEKTSHLLANITGQDNSLDALIHDAERREKLEQLSLAVEDATPPAIALEHSLHPLQSFVILPLFALFSAGVAFSAENLAGFPSGVELGVILGLVAGKPLGALLAAWLVVKLAKVDLIDVTLPQLVGAGCLAGIGFTMSIFISELAFTTDAMIDQAKLGILVASVAAGVLGAIVLHFTLPPKAD